MKDGQLVLFGVYYRRTPTANATVSHPLQRVCGGHGPNSKQAGWLDQTIIARVAVSMSSSARSYCSGSDFSDRCPNSARLTSATSFSSRTIRSSAYSAELARKLACRLALLAAAPSLGLGRPWCPVTQSKGVTRVSGCKGSIRISAVLRRNRSTQLRAGSGRQRRGRQLRL